jgi:hypothetical protein
MELVDELLRECVPILPDHGGVIVGVHQGGFHVIQYVSMTIFDHDGKYDA